MLAYAANRPIVAQRRPSPNAMLAIIAAHVAVVALVMSAKMDVSRRIFDPPTRIDLLPTPKPPPPDPLKSRPAQHPVQATDAGPQPQLPIPPISSQTNDTASQPFNFDQLLGSSTGPRQQADPIPLPQPVKLEARLLTPASDLRPPYPQSKIASGEEALLRLRLTIDEHGRVIAVEPVGRADRVFLEAARRHLLVHWRYSPASQDGRAVMSSAVITLRFQLDG